MHLKFLKNSAGKKGMIDMIERFNCNIPYSGLLHSVTQDVRIYYLSAILVSALTICFFNKAA